MSTRRSLRPRSATTRCLTLPSSRKASTTRTYALTVPLEERTLTVLGYMGEIITTRFRFCKEIIEEDSEKSESNCHYTVRDGGGSPEAQGLENKAFSRAAAADSGGFTPNMGKRRPVKYVDEWVQRDGYEGAVRQLIVTGLGHESPTFFLTNDRPQPQTARDVIQTYASRHHVANHLGEQITSFHPDCLCSDVRLNVDFDLTLTVLADLPYRSLAERVKGFAQAGPSKLFRKFVDTPGMIEITTKGVVVRLSKRAHNPLLKEAGLTQPTRAVPWLGGRCVHLVCP